MDLTSAKTIKELLLKHHTHPSKTMGQNFLIDKNILQKIIEAADISVKDTVIEIGPGIGTLTQKLAKKAKKVIAIEKDQTMVDIATETLREYKNIEVLQGDILKMTNGQTPMANKNQRSKIGNWDLGIKDYKVVANIPYYITSPIIRMFLEVNNQPAQIILTIQKEVAQRICAAPPNMSILAVSVQYYATAQIISYVSRACFWPSPNVDSAIIKITPVKKAKSNTKKPFKESDSDLFFKIVKAGFSHPRKQLANNLSKALNKNKEETTTWLIKNNLSPLQRAETLAIQDWINLVNNF